MTFTPKIIKIFKTLFTDLFCNFWTCSFVSLPYSKTWSIVRRIVNIFLIVCGFHYFYPQLHFLKWICLWLLGVNYYFFYQQERVTFQKYFFYQAVFSKYILFSFKASWSLFSNYDLKQICWKETLFYQIGYNLHKVC